MEKSVKERLQVQVLMEIVILIVLTILNIYKLFNFNQLIYNIMDNIIDLFDIKYSQIIKNIIEILPFLIVYITSIHINFHNVKFLTKEYIDEYIFKIITVNIYLYIAIFLFFPFNIFIFLKFSRAIYIFILIVLKILYAIIYFKIKSKTFISEEEYIKEQQQKALIKKVKIDKNSEQKRINNVKKIKIFFCVIFVLWILNRFIFFLIPSCRLLETCEIDWHQIFGVSSSILFWIFFISSLLIIIKSIIIVNSNKK